MPPTATITDADTDTEATGFLWLVITGRCQLECDHCYAESGPSGTHGAMTTDDWGRVIDDAAASGVRTVQFVGGEPTMHPGLPDLVAHALAVGMGVEIYTNLFHVTDRMWEVFSRPGVGLATSYYSADPGGHEQTTGRPGSHVRTRTNIVEVLRRNIPLRVGLIDTGNGDVDGAHSELLGLGVANIRRDVVRALGRAYGGGAKAGACGACGLGRAAIQPDGRITPCVMTSDLDGGNVRTTPLADLLTGNRWLDAVGSVPRALSDPCAPDRDNEPCGPVWPEPSPDVV